MPLRRAVRAAVPACALLLPARAVAQTAAGTTNPAACVDGIPDSALVGMTVYLEASARGAEAKALLPAVDLLTQEVANRVRTLLGAPTGGLPASSPGITWRSRGWDLTLVAHRDGRLAWQPTPPRWDGQDRYGIHDADVEARGDAPAVAVVMRALEELRASGEAVVGPWPNRLRADSATFELDLRFAAGDTTHRTAYHGPPLRMGFPIFSLATPRTAPVRIERAGRLQYPEDARAASTTGTIILQYVVDTTGRVDTTTVRDLWPDDAPPLTAQQRPHYLAFVDAARRVLPEARFAPARIGGCVVRQLVQQPFVFNLR